PSPVKQQTAPSTQHTAEKEQGGLMAALTFLKELKGTAAQSSSAASEGEPHEPSLERPGRRPVPRRVRRPGRERPGNPDRRDAGRGQGQEEEPEEEPEEEEERKEGEEAGQEAREEGQQGQEAEEELLVVPSENKNGIEPAGPI